MRRLQDQRGVAMVTVLLIGSALTAVTSVAAFATIREFRAGRDDRRATEAIAIAEAGIDRMISHIKSGLLTYNQLNTAGCSKPAVTLPPGNIGAGSYAVELTVYDPAADPANRMPIPPASGACANRPTSPHPGQDGLDRTYFQITSVGTNTNAVRKLRQVIALEPVGLPVGIYAHAFSPKAHPRFSTVTVISETTFLDRAKDAFLGTDSYYLMRDLFPDGVTGRSINERVPAAAHAVQGIFLKNSTNPEFTGPPNGTKNCTANSDGPPAESNPSQSLWDSDGSSGAGAITSGCPAVGGDPGQVGYPNSSVFTQEQLERFARPRLSEEDHQTLKENAKLFGVYCTFPGFGGTGNTQCVVNGVNQPVNQSTYGGVGGYIATLLGTRNSFITYFEFRSGTPTQNNLDQMFPSVWPCDPDPALTKSIVAVVRNGGINWTGAAGQQINGALIMDGDFRATGGLTLNGSLISLGTVEFGSSSQTMQLDECWVQNMPGPFFRVVPGQWSEIDR